MMSKREIAEAIKESKAKAAAYALFLKYHRGNKVERIEESLHMAIPVDEVIIDFVSCYTRMRFSYMYDWRTDETKVSEKSIR